MDNTFLFISLFSPRICLLWYYANGWMFPNFVPFWADFALSVFLPRILILIYIYQNLGASNGWFIAHVIFAILAYAGSASKEVSKSKK